MNKIEIGKIIKVRRKFLKITQKDLAEIVGLSLRNFVDIENGKANPTLDALQKITEALGLEITVKVD
ncbi:MAG: helix-turn-helix domain-containing protein [Melioribacteraceae bacterium]|nr:helix-turn-helix domain-containing protein [Melioribacteraceae bacterium]MCO6472361.1 helix-turn-helix transcriptional regulator [Melioribacteraceae bacterium]MDD3557998.1 helix-turn-helix domain-containing protein [Melioribacteraceae bacterium]